jgi:hypothetical protein
MFAVVFQPIEQVTAANLTKSPLCPLGRCIDRDMACALKGDVTAAINREEWATAPALTGRTMAGTNVRTRRAAGKTHSAAQALSVSFFVASILRS